MQVLEAAKKARDLAKKNLDIATSTLNAAKGPETVGPASAALERARWAYDVAKSAAEKAQKEFDANVNPKASPLGPDHDSGPSSSTHVHEARSQSDVIEVGETARPDGNDGDENGKTGLPSSRPEPSGERTGTESPDDAPTPMSQNRGGRDTV